MKKMLIVLFCLVCTLLLVACDMGNSHGPTATAAQGQSPRVEALAATREITKFTVSRAFSSDMVIQRDEPIRIWGWAPASRNGATVTATFMGQSAEGKVEDGAWLVTFPEGFAASAAMGQDMTVTCGEDKVVFADVLVGDVYMVIGQSNVAYGMNAHCANHGLSISSFADADAPIRLKYNTLNDTAGYPARGTTEVCEDVVNGRPWWRPTVSNINQFTALGYLFAQEIVAKTDGEIPIGIIEIDGNGQPIGAFMPNEAAGATDSDTYNKNTGIYVPPGVNGTYARYMYNHYIYPYEQYAVAGLVWYQGESDFQKENADTFVTKFVTLMEHMRSTHNLANRDFPVYIVEIPTIYNKPADFTGAWHVLDLGYIRAEMGSIPQRLSNSYLAVSSDLFTDDRYANSLHPDIKDGQAKRLADLAAGVRYNLTSLDEATGPILKDYTASEDRKTVVLTFANVGEGLTTADGGTAVKGFMAFNRVGGFSTTASLSATITAPDQITITSGVAIYGVAYNCVMDNLYGEEVNLCNSNGKIAAAFTFAEARMYQVRREWGGEDAVRTELSADDVVAVHFHAVSDVLSVGTQVRTDGATGNSVTLALYAFNTDFETTVTGTPVATKTFADSKDFGWVELAQGRNRAWGGGEYLLVVSGAESVAVLTGGAHEGQVLYRNGAYAEASSLLLGVRYESKTETPYAIPHDPNTALPETHPETQPQPESETSAVTETTSEAETETTPEAETDPTEETVPASDTEAESSLSDKGGCGSMLGGVWMMLLLSMAAYGFLRRKNAGKGAAS